ncbi:hypothetical protein OG455_41810 [Kitasatospora sp. NBC_01287]|uniref:hypothetical protein n=1 Tax=Kitasatospora sp. NBC_01287 TaxID=2903573 RepID=UPI002254F430|nr:hypothetical protein [Kitasatospora sp. NBC_01287]MCX4751727.1 hypothetical protein [Kitasatospora sp. NBC_01287]MCX4751981.1 hypothetical protein [Kitasatospora sp. NBC_01287]
MARIRSIKPELRTSITVSSWPFEVRYFFVLLWGYLDDYGRGVDDELLIASDCFPRDRGVTPDVVDKWLETMAESGPVCRYEVDGRRYLHCPNWPEHQKPQHPGKPRVPPCPDDEPDDFLMWRGANPPRQRDRSRKSREGLMSVSPAPFGASFPPSGGVDFKGETPLKGSVVSLLDRGSSIKPSNNITADQTPCENPHENVVNLSGAPHETLTPEQGAGSREQGSREKDNSAAKPHEADTRRADVEQACQLLADLVHENGSTRPTVTQRWRDAARLMLDKDGRTLDEVLGAIRWCQADEFWRSNVMAMPKLRSQYDRLRLEAQRKRNAGAQLAATGTDGRQLSTADRRVHDAAQLAARLAAEENQ